MLKQFKCHIVNLCNCSLSPLRHHAPSFGHTFRTNAFWLCPHYTHVSWPRGDFLRKTQWHLYLLRAHSRVSKTLVTLTHSEFCFGVGD